MNKKTVSSILITIVITAIITSVFAVFVVFPRMENDTKTITNDGIEATDSDDGVVQLSKADYDYLISLYEKENSVSANELEDATETDNEDVVKVNKADYDYLVSLYDKYKKVEALEEYIRDNYYQDVEEIDFMSEILKGLFKALDDPYSVYFTPEEFKMYTESATGEYEGIGVVVAPGEDGFITVVSPIHDSPGFDAGLKTNDKILKVDGMEFFADELEEAVRNIRGPAASTVVLTIRRDDEIIDIPVVRKKIKLEAVASEVLEDGIGYIKMSQFDQDVAKEFSDHLAQLEKENIKGLVLDLRYNGGGYLSQCLQITNMLIGEGIIVKTKDNNGNVDIERSDAAKIDYPLVIIVNEGSASASEILTGAVKDNEEGIVIGTTTFGKGLVQTMLPLTTFDDSGFKLTVEQYFTPDDHYINGVGIDPDIVIEDDQETEEDEQLLKAIEIISEEIK